ncbi:MAG: hypothetical protein V1703_01535 [Candidatus Altiarchaeota archaeon]
MKDTEVKLNEGEVKLAEELAQLIAEEERLKKKDSKKEIENIVSEKIYGPGLVNKDVNVGWGSLLSRKKCPCGGPLEMKEEDYACSQCGIKIPKELYDKAREQHEREFVLREKEMTVRKKMDEMKLEREKVNNIYLTAIKHSKELQQKDGKKA